MYIWLSMADFVVKPHSSADSEGFGQIERSLPVCLQLYFLAGRFQSDSGDRSFGHRRWVMVRRAFLKPFRFLKNARGSVSKTGK